MANFATDPGMLNQPDDFGNTPLHHAAMVGSTICAYVLIVHGCNLDPLNHRNLTPLMTALENNRPDTARMLLFLGASPFLLTPQFESALTMAIEMVRLFCDVQ